MPGMRTAKLRPHPLAVGLPVPLRAAVIAIATREGVSVSSVLRTFVSTGVEDYLAEHPLPESAEPAAREVEAEGARVA